MNYAAHVADNEKLLMVSYCSWSGATTHEVEQLRDDIMNMIDVDSRNGAHKL